MMTLFVVGVDICKAHLDVFVQQTGRHHQFANNQTGCRRLAEMLADAAAGQDLLVVFEATSCYDQLLCDALHTADLACARVNPRRARQFARAAGLLAKTDRVDARMLALMGARLELKREVPADRQAREVAALLDRRAQLVDERKRLRTQMKQAEFAGLADILAEMKTALDDLSSRIAAYARRLEERLRSAPPIARRAQIARSLPGFGPVLAASYAVRATELGTIDRRSAAALIGVAPLACDSQAPCAAGAAAGAGAKPCATSCTWGACRPASTDPSRLSTTG
jgi:transposase